MTINEICEDFAINLQLTQGSGFYRVYERETCNPDRRIVLRTKKSKKFIDDFTGTRFYYTMINFDTIRDSYV